MCWFYQKIKSYAESVDLDAAERTIIERSKAKETGGVDLPRFSGQGNADRFRVR